MKTFQRLYTNGASDCLAQGRKRAGPEATEIRVLRENGSTVRKIRMGQSLAEIPRRFQDSVWRLQTLWLHLWIQGRQWKRRGVSNSQRQTVSFAVGHQGKSLMETERALTVPNQQNKSVVATAVNGASSLRSGRLIPAVPHFRHSLIV